MTFKRVLHPQPDVKKTFNSSKREHAEERGGKINMMITEIITMG